MKKKDETTKLIEKVVMLCPMCGFPVHYGKREGQTYTSVVCPHCGVSITVKEAEERDEVGG